MSDTGIKVRRAIQAKDLRADGMKAYFAWDPKSGKPAPSDLHVANIIGNATGYEVKHGQAPNGDPTTSLVLNGMFEAQKVGPDGSAVGEAIVAAGIFLPGAFGDLVQAELDGLARNERGVAPSVTFSVRLDATYTGKGEGYAWSVSSLMAQRTDPLVEARKAMHAAGLAMRKVQLQIAGPVAVETPHDAETGEIAETAADSVEEHAPSRAARRAK